MKKIIHEKLRLVHRIEKTMLTTKQKRLRKTCKKISENNLQTNEKLKTREYKRQQPLKHENVVKNKAEKKSYYHRRFETCYE